MKAQELREMKDPELQGKLKELEQERFELRFKAATEPVSNVRRFRAIRRDIARIRTIMQERVPG